MEYTPSFRDQLQNGIEPSWKDDLDAELYHHGIKGQKWGVRRPRNEDGILQGAGAGLFARMKAKRQKKKEAKQQYKSDVAKAKQDFGNFAKKADAKYAKDKRYGTSGQLGRDMEKGIDRLNASKAAAKKRYKQTINADKIAKLEAKRSKAQKAAGRDASMQKHIKKQNIAVRALMAPTSGAAGVSRAVHQHKANKAQRRINRLSK